MKTTFKEINKGTKKYILPYFKVDKGVVEKIKEFQCVRIKLLNGRSSKGVRKEQIEDGILFYTDDKDDGVEKCRVMELIAPEHYSSTMQPNPEYEQVTIEFLTNTNAGIVHEGLIAVMIKDLESRNELVNSIETGQVIIKLQECLQLLRQREKDRSDRNVLGSNKE